MTALELADVPLMPLGNRLQFEPSQQAYVLLFPEGMVKLSQSAAEILKRVDGEASVAEIVKSLEQAYPGADLKDDVTEFLSTAYAKGWIRKQDK